MNNIQNQKEYLSSSDNILGSLPNNVVLPKRKVKSTQKMAGCMKVSHSYWMLIAYLTLVTILIIYYIVLSIIVSSKLKSNEQLKQEENAYMSQVKERNTAISSLGINVMELKDKDAKLTDEVNHLKQQINSIETEKVSILNNPSIKQIEINISRKNNKEREAQIRRNNKKETELNEGISNKRTELKKLINRFTINMNYDFDVVTYVNVMKSNIITSHNYYNTLRRFLSKYMRDDVGFFMAYSATRDGYDAKLFHKRCDRYSTTIVLVKSDLGCVFGGFTTQYWDKSGYKKDEEAFLFNFNYNKKYDIDLPSTAIYTWNDNMPVFGEFDLAVRINKEVTSSFPLTYGHGSPKRELTCGIQTSTIEELEVLIMFEDDYE